MMRSYWPESRSMKARPSPMCTVTRGSWYGWLGWYFDPSDWMTGSISTASTCLAPWAKATATSLPLPAPTTRTRSGGPARCLYGNA